MFHIKAYRLSMSIESVHFSCLSSAEAFFAGGVVVP